MSDIDSILSSAISGVLLSDGAMGTMLHQKGIDFEKCFDELNVTHPAIVGDIHRAYIESGSQMIQTNTFGANRIKLGRHGLEKSLEEINRQGVEVARRVVDGSFKQVFIAGDVGPLGVRIAPFGRVQPEEAREFFKEQVNCLVHAGVDLLIFETFADLYEIREAVAAARLVDPSIPVVASMTFTRDDITLLGDTPDKIARNLADVGVDVVGVNCSGGPAQILRILRRMKAALSDGKFSVMPNAGWPEQAGGRIMYPAAPEYFGDYATLFRNYGAVILGGCCGTTPEHIASMRKALDKPIPIEKLDSLIIIPDHKPEVTMPEQMTHMGTKLQQGKFVVAVEMDPPRGLSTQKLLAGASLLAEAGADVIDVADSPMARMRMSPWAVCSLIQKKANIETVLHFPTRGRNILRVQGDLLAAHALDIRNVFVVMGDPTAIGDYPEAMDNYDLVPSGLIKLIKQGFNLGMDYAGSEIGQPTSFFAGCALNLSAQDVQTEIKNLQRKIKAGADFILTQPVFEPDEPRKFLKAYEQQHGHLPIPMLVGVLPLNNPRHARFLHNEVPGISIPERILERLEKAGDKSPMEGVIITSEIICKLKDIAQGVYIMPAFNRYDLAAAVIDRVSCNS